MQKNLIQYLRAALPQMREGTSNLGREILQARSYLEILKVRMDERLQFSIHVPQGLLSAAFPPMMLLTLVENAIKHGLEPKPDGGSLSLSAVIADGQLRVAVADSGVSSASPSAGGRAWAWPTCASACRRSTATRPASSSTPIPTAARSPRSPSRTASMPRRSAACRARASPAAPRRRPHRPYDRGGGGRRTCTREPGMSILIVAALAVVAGTGVLLGAGLLVGGVLVVVALVAAAILAGVLVALVVAGLSTAAGVGLGVLVLLVLAGCLFLPLVLPLLLLYWLVRPRRRAASGADAMPARRTQGG